MGASLPPPPLQDLLLAILFEREPIKLAPSSAQIPPLLNHTKQNIFNVRAQQEAQRAQAEQLARRESQLGLQLQVSIARLCLADVCNGLLQGALRSSCSAR